MSRLARYRTSLRLWVQPATPPLLSLSRALCASLLPSPRGEKTGLHVCQRSFLHIVSLLWRSVLPLGVSVLRTAWFRYITVFVFLFGIVVTVTGTVITIATWHKTMM